jgi:hypothetical protein
MSAVEGVERDMAPAEAAELRRIAAGLESLDAATVARRVMFVAGLLAWGVAWWAAGVVVMLAGWHLDIGSHGAAAPYIALAGIVVAGAWAHKASRRYTARGLQARFRDELAGGRVREATYTFTAARRFQEPEHGGIVYFLREADGRVYCLYDEESQDLACGGGDPLASPLRPRTRMTVVRTPSSGHVLARDFSGDPLEAGELDDLVAKPEHWPESDEWCDCAWERLDARFGPARA